MQPPHLVLIRRWWRTLVLATMVAGATAFVLAVQLPETYEAQTKILVGPISAEINTLRGASELTQTYAELASSQPVLEPVVDELDLGYPWQELQAEMTVQADGTTRVITIRAPATDPGDAAAVVTAIADRLIEIAGPGDLTPEGEMTVIEPALPPLEPSGQGRAQVTLLGAGAGFLAAMLIIVVVEFLTDAIRDRYDLPPAAQRRLFGVISLHGVGRATGPDRLFVGKGVADSDAAVSYQVLAGQVLPEDDAAQPALVVLGVGRADGGGEAAANLAVALTAVRARVRLIDANQFQPEVGAILGYNFTPDALNLAQYDFSSKRATRQTIIRGGQRDAAQGPDSARGRRLLTRLRANTDALVIHAPPLEQSAAALVWSQFADTTILVAQVDRTSRRSLARAVEDISRNAAITLGIVLRERAESWSRPSGGRSSSRVPRAAGTRRSLWRRLLRRR
jgi:succinoglycan biosynthesis transport protein ExoP